LNAANASIHGVAGTNFASIADAQAALRTAHLDILSQTTQDPALANAGFVQAPQTLADPVHAAHGSFAEIGAIFDDFVSHSLGGISSTTAPALAKEVSAIQNDLQHLMKAHPEEFQGLTGIHAQAIVNQLGLEKTYIKQASSSPFAARGTNDNLLDIIDIVQGDTNLANMANFGGAHGWSATADALNPTPKYQDNASQTNFWADFIAESNSLGQAAEHLVGSQDKAGIQTLIHDLKLFQQNTQNFDAAQGGIFGARFDNELLGAKSTTGAEVAALIKGLQTGNAALVAAGAEQMHANAADVGGNNIPLNGGTYNGDALTIADALSTATGPLPPPPITTLAPAFPPVVAAAAPTPAAAVATAPAAVAAATPGAAPADAGAAPAAPPAPIAVAAAAPANGAGGGAQQGGAPNPDPGAHSASVVDHAGVNGSHVDFHHMHGSHFDFHHMWG
jgi:hypothetical protein